ncbi:hypothetical protein K0I73_00340 [Shewanella mesophila]|uniref:hypothetical protein n=1 Tax=Shewanella mesophila TaxID=2864208 RepID=UPI001C654CAC|nr:hypothetical protein [Shewanella mesophila]QYJ86268.1 hypothetical protein K0I73_00340 [Shewanella mesophila]
MDSIINFEEFMDRQLTPEQKLARYRACLFEFEQLNYEDAFIQQVKRDVKQLETLISTKPKRHHLF